MEYQRSTVEFKNQSRRNIKLLVNEGITGVTKKHTLSSTGKCLWCPEAELMYFKAVRDFFETDTARRIMNINQDPADIKVMRIIRKDSCTSYNQSKKLI